MSPAGDAPAKPSAVRPQGGKRGAGLGSAWFRAGIHLLLGADWVGTLWLLFAGVVSARGGGERTVTGGRGLATMLIANLSTLPPLFAGLFLLIPLSWLARGGDPANFGRGVTADNPDVVGAQSGLAQPLGSILRMSKAVKPPAECRW